MRNLGLDILRFSAVLLVLGQHLNGDYLVEVPRWALGFFTFWRHGGGVGVTLFFVLSGFLISGLLFDEFRRTGTVDTRRFLIRRGFKLYPPLWALIGFAVLLNAVRQSQPWPAFLPKVLAELLFVQNYFPGLIGHTWTLAVEEHFYIAFAALTAWLCAQARPNAFHSIPIVWAAVAIACALLRLLTVASSVEPAWSNFRVTHLCVDALMFGVLLSYLCRFRQLDFTLQKVPTVALLAAGGLGICQAFTDQPPTFATAAFAPTLTYAGCGLALLAARRLESASSRALGFLGFLGSTSYSTYLWHGWMNILAARGFTKVFGFSNTWVYLLIYLAGSFVLGIVMHRIVELPVMALRDRLFPSRTALLPAARPDKRDGSKQKLRKALARSR
jgi:peptidoglycan/LPS O-acetylase OafA/YrhL